MNEIRAFRGEYFYLSNFFRCEFEVAGLGNVRSAEHAYNAFKTTDDVSRRWVLEAETPAEAKRRGRSLGLSDDWLTGGRVNAMLTVVAHKFSDPVLQARLRDTGNAVLIEGNTHHDDFWGDCTCGGSDCGDPGRNMLGEILMATRTRLRIDRG